MCWVCIGHKQLRIAMFLLLLKGKGFQECQACFHRKYSVQPGPHLRGTTVFTGIYLLLLKKNEQYPFTLLSIFFFTSSPTKLFSYYSKH